MKIKILIATLVIFILSMIIYQKNYSPEAKGIQAAKKDIINNSLKYKIYGELHPKEDLIEAEASNKYNIKLKRVAGCVIDGNQQEEWDSYNKTVSDYALKKWGIKNILNSVCENNEIEE